MLATSHWGNLQDNLVLALQTGHLTPRILGATSEAMCASKDPKLSHAISASILIAALGLTNCGWERKITFKDPNSASLVEIRQPFPLNVAGLKIVLLDGRRETLLLNRRADTFLSFADVVWRANPATVGVFACTGGTRVEVAFDRAKSEPVAFDTIGALIADHIRHEYGINNNESERDVLRWACQEGQREFLRRHPEAQTK